jgi:hypothetical protein
MVREDSKISPEDFFHDKVDEHKQPALVERTNTTLTNEKTADVTAKLVSELEE